MKMLDIVVGYLDDEATMDQKLSELGAIHNKRYGVKPEHYKHFRTAFMKAIKTYIPWNYQRENAWLWYWNRIIQIMSTSAQKKEPIVSLDITPETATEYIFAIYESFENVTDSPATFGKAFYQALVNGQCEIANLFAKTEFEFQCARIVAKTRHTLFLLDDQATFQEKVMSSAYQYFGHDIKIPQLQLFGEIFIETLKTTNNGQWQPIYSEAWEWLLRLIITVLQIELEDIKKNASKRVLINDDSDNTSSISSKIQLQVTQTGADNTKEKNKKN
jgi:hemoglobin-like flavoprotein